MLEYDEAYLFKEMEWPNLIPILICNAGSVIFIWDTSRVPMEQVFCGATTRGALGYHYAADRQVVAPLTDPFCYCQAVQSPFFKILIANKDYWNQSEQRAI